MNRPRVILCGQASVDGRITLAPDVLLLFGDERWPHAYDPMRRWIETHRPHAMLEGSGSFVAEGSEPSPLPPAAEGEPLGEDYLPDDIAARSGFCGWFVVVDGRGRVRWAYTGEPGREAPGSEGWHLLVLVSKVTPRDVLAYLRREHVPYLVAGEDHVDLAAALVKLRALGVETLLVTSPGKLGHAMLRADLVDEIQVEILPIAIGGARTPSLLGGPELGVGQSPWPLALRSVDRHADGLVILRYDVLRAS
ncbi:MAG: dihydrofolate reductase family protein [Candidatus Bipolaricaulota bacterium]